MADPLCRRLVALLLDVQASLFDGHEAYLALRLLRDQRPNSLLDEGCDQRHIDDDQLVQALGEVALLGLQPPGGRCRIQVHAQPHAVQVPNVHGLLHALRQVVDGLKHRDQTLIKEHRVQLVLQAHVQHGTLLSVGADDAAVPRELKLPGRQQFAVALPPAQRGRVLASATAHVTIVLTEKPPAEGLVAVFFREVAEVGGWSPAVPKRHEFADLSL
mmetsp:Transcript_103511/g.299494  ORF Transcript_103511/g.299494 Transcript_103511/m.299494 type:complete len:216 (-) Transcript_103511:621-1268(-)